ncbi:hypothetical protein GS682_04990 [Nostoc sp. B(2019)]|nr:hypothetical protein [Nostoc sp. B(2019)]
MNNPFSSNSSDASENAKSLLVHYLQNAANGNAPISEDNFAEISDLVDSIIEAAVEKAVEESLEKMKLPINRLS